MLERLRNKTPLTDMERRVLPHIRQFGAHIEAERYADAHASLDYAIQFLPEDSDLLTLRRLMDAPGPNKDQANAALTRFLVLRGLMTGKDAEIEQSLPQGSLDFHEDATENTLSIRDYLAWLLSAPELFIYKKEVLGLHLFTQTGSKIGAFLSWLPMLITSLGIGIHEALSGNLWVGFGFILYQIALWRLTQFMSKLEEGPSALIVIGGNLAFLSLVAAGVSSLTTSAVLIISVLASYGMTPFLFQKPHEELGKKFASGIAVAAASIFIAAIFTPIDRLVEGTIGSAPIGPVGMSVFSFVLSTLSLAALFEVFTLAAIGLILLVAMSVSFIISGMLEINLENRNRAAGVVLLVLISMLNIVLLILTATHL